MPMDIRQAFLRNPEETQLLIPRQSWQIVGKFDARSDAAAFGKSLDVPSQGGRQSELIEQRRMKKIGHRANVLRDLINQIRVLLRASCCIRAKIRFLAEYPRNVHAHSSYELSHAVVQFAGDASSFLVLNLQETRRELGFPAGPFSLLTPGNVSGHRKLDDGAILVPKRRAMGFHASARALQSHNIELQSSFLAAADLFVESTKSVPVFRGDQVINALANDPLSAIGANHGQPG